MGAGSRNDKKNQEPKKPEEKPQPIDPASVVITSNENEEASEEKLAEK